MKFKLYTLERGGTQVAEVECLRYELFRKLEDAISEYDSTPHTFPLDHIVILSDTGRKLVVAQNRCNGGYLWCCWRPYKRNTINKQWQLEFNQAFKQDRYAFMGW